MKQGLAGTLQPLTVNNIGGQQISSQQQQQHQQQQPVRQQSQPGMMMNQNLSSNTTGPTNLTFTDPKRITSLGVGVGPPPANTASTMPIVSMASCTVCRQEMEQNNLAKCTDCLKLFCQRCGQNDPSRQVNNK